MKNLETDTPKFAVLLAAYNGMKWLPDQVESILKQEGVSVTLFVSVDSSEDGTEEWFDDLAISDRRVILLEHGHKFGGAAPNFFRLFNDVDFSSYDYVSLADQDDIWILNKLLRAHSIIKEKNAFALSSNVIAFWPGGHKKLIIKNQPQVKWDYLFESAGPGCTFVINKVLATKFKSFLTANVACLQDVGNGQHDWLIYAFSRSQGYKWVIDCYSGMFYRQHEKNQFGVNSGLNAFLFRVNKVLDGWWLTQSLLFARLTGVVDDPFVIRWSKGGGLGLLWLALHANLCRRSIKDKILFVFACLAIVIARRQRNLFNKV